MRQSLRVGLFLVALAGLGVVTAGISMVATGKLVTTSKDACAGRQPGAVHRVTMQDDKVSTPHISAKLCDQLVIANLDDKSRLVAFGKHEQHEAYDGVTERLLLKGQSLSVTLNKTGDFRYHDHLQNEVQGFFTVTR